MFILDGPKDFFLMDMFEWYMEQLSVITLKYFSDILCFEFLIFGQVKETLLEP